MDIRLKAPYPAGALSNLAVHSFVIDGVACACMEGFLQSLKFEDVDRQIEICGKPGPIAQSLGRASSDWKRGGTLWWQGVAYHRTSEEYQLLIDRAFECLAANEAFRAALAETGTEELTHLLGRDDPARTILTPTEFCSRLVKLRASLSKADTTRRA